MDIIDEFTEQPISTKWKIYFLLQKEMLVTEATDKVAKLVTMVLMMAVLGIFIWVAIASISFGLGLYLNTLWETTFAGFGVTGVLFGLLALLFYYIPKKKLINSVTFIILKKMNS